MRSLFSSFISLALASIASGAQYNATPSNYTTFLPTLQPGDTLNLATGNYPFLNISGLNGTPQAWITITGPVSGPPATIYATSACCNTVQITNSSYLAIKNLTVDSKGLAYIDGINAHNGTNNTTHDILIEGNTITGQNANQQTCGISTKTPTWGWIIRNNVINGAGTGIYLGNSDGTDPFIGGIVENNLIENTIGYDGEIKYQIARPVIAGMPTGQSFTIIRNNVFIKNDQASPDGDRPNLLVGSFPASGAGSTDIYEIYGNFFYHNPRESLLQVEGRVSVHDNVFVDANFAAINLEGIDGPLQIAYLYNNTVYTQTRGFYFGVSPTVDSSVTGNLMFAATPIAGSVAVSNNITDTFANASHYVNAPSLTLGAMNFFPLAGQATGSALDLSKSTNDPDYSLDFNGNPKGSPAIYRGAYAGAGTNPGWQLQAGIKPTGTTLPAALSTLVCQPAAVTSGGASQCTVSLAGAANGNITVTLGSSNASLLGVPPTVAVLNGMTSASFSATAGTVALSQAATVTATLNGVSLPQTVTVNPLPGVAAVSSLSCVPTSIASSASANCTVVLTVAPTSNATVVLTTGNALLQAAPSVQVNAGSLNATFPVTAGTITATQGVAVTAALNGTSASFTLTLQAPIAFYLQGNRVDTPSLANGAAVTPENFPTGLTGKVVVRGTGSASYAPQPDGDGLTFAKSGDQNTNTAFVAFSGTPVSSLFNVSHGDLTFYLKSNYSLASRLSAIPNEYVFQADDGSQQIAYFSVGASSSRLVFYLLAGGAGNYYYVPAGQEDILFGNGVVAKFRITWNGSLTALYINDVNVLSYAYTPVTPHWTAGASFTIGATSTNIFSGGYYATSDSIADFLIVASGSPTAPQVSLNPTGLTFAAQNVNTSSTAQGVTLTNPGTAALAITSIAVTGANSGDFTETNTCGASVAAGGNCSISVTFKPTAAGTRTAAVSITDNAAGSPHSVSLTGAGSQAGAPQVSLNPTSLTFASQSLNTTSIGQSVTLGNPGTAALAITSIAITGANNGDFAQTNTCGTGVAAAGNCSISVTFTPTASGTRSAAVTITDNAAGSPHSFSLTGTGAGGPSFLLYGNSTDVPSLLNGATITPENHPTGLTGKVVVRGAGGASYSPQSDGNGLTFIQGGGQNTNTAFLAFSGTPVSSLFNVSQGDVTVSVKSNYNLANRLTALPAEYVFQADDGGQRIAYLAVITASSRLVFYVLAGGVGNYYYVPAGQEDVLFGKGVTAQFRITWNGTATTLYINGTSVLSYRYAPVTPNWSPGASFTIGATSTNMYSGGYYATGDSVADLLIK